jgi:hypothetical protein
MCIAQIQYIISWLLFQLTRRFSKVRMSNRILKRSFPTQHTTLNSRGLSWLMHMENSKEGLMMCREITSWLQGEDKYITHWLLMWLKVQCRLYRKPKLNKGSPDFREKAILSVRTRYPILGRKHNHLTNIPPSSFIVELPSKTVGGGGLMGGLMNHCGWCDNQSRPLFPPSSALIGMLLRAILCALFSCPLGQGSHDVSPK